MLFENNQPNVKALASLIKAVPNFAMGLVWATLETDKKLFNEQNKSIIKKWLNDAMEMIASEQHENVSIDPA